MTKFNSPNSATRNPLRSPAGPYPCPAWEKSHSHTSAYRLLPHQIHPEIRRAMPRTLAGNLRKNITKYAKRHKNRNKL